ncbi:MAG: carboxypeptidase-like regulatory domain-containing protein [bacterium]
MALVCSMLSCGDNIAEIDRFPIPKSIEKVAGDEQVGAIGAPLPISVSVRVLSDFGTPFSMDVPFSVATGGGRVSDSTVYANNNGIASVIWTLGESPGENTVVVDVDLDGAPLTFTATAVPVTDRLRITTQPPAIVPNDARLIPNPVIQLEDSAGVPLTRSGVVVTASIASGPPGELTSVRVVETIGGAATFSDLRITGTPGEYRIRFTAPGFEDVTSASILVETTLTMRPLPDLGTRVYFGHQGGLYPGGANEPPSEHAAEGAARAQAIAPLDTSGAPATEGKIVLMSVGMSNTTQEWCTMQPPAPCNAWSFTGMAAALGNRREELVIANGAKPTEVALNWDEPTDANYPRVRDDVLAPRGLTERQVQIVWLKTGNRQPTVGLAASSVASDAHELARSIGRILRSLKIRYPNLQMVFVSSRIYGGYASIPLNPEPYAFESGFAVKWVIGAQVEQMAAGGVLADSLAGDLNYETVAPWVAWGPYLWADGENASGDGLTWVRGDFESDGTHPAQPGEQKVAERLIAFFTTSPFATPWFLSGSN